MKHKILANVGFNNNGLYNGTFTSTDDSLMNVFLNSSPTDFNLYFGGNGVPIQSSAKANAALNKISDITRNGGVFYAFDLETLGKFDGTKEEQKAFAITEASLKKFSIVNGKLKIENVQDLRLGMNKEQISAIKLMYAQAKINPKSLTESQIFTLKTLSATGSALKSNGLNTFEIAKDGMPVIPQMANNMTTDTLDFASINHALNAYEDLERKGLYMSNVKGMQTKGNVLFNNFMNSLGIASNDSIVLGHNSNIFDIPAIDYASSKYFGKRFSIGDGSIDTLELMRNIGFNTKELYQGSSLDINSGYAKLENLAKLFGVDIGTAHVGSDDVTRLGMLGFAKINFNGENQTIFDILLNKANSNISSAQAIKANSGNVFRVVQAPGLRDLKGNYLKEGSKSFDFVIDVTDTGSVMLNQYAKSPLHANGFYNFNGITTINVQDILNSEYGMMYSDIFKDLPEGTNQLFAGVFTNVADPSKKSFIIRDELESVQKTIESTFELTNGITMDTAIREEKMYRRDLARREISSFEQPGTKGMNHANMYYEQLKEIKEYEEILGRPFTEEELRNISTNKQSTFGDYVFKDTDIFNKLKYNGKDEIVASRVNVFIEARKYLESTAPVADFFAPVINKAYSDLEKYDYVRNGKTLAYRSSWNKLDNWVENNGGNLITQSNESTNISKSKTLRIAIDDYSNEYYSLDVSSKSKLKKSLKTIANKEVLNNVNTNTKDLAKSQNLDSVYDKLSNLLTTEQIESLKKNKSIQYEIEEAAEYIYKNIQDNYKGLSTDDLSNPFTTRNNLNKLLNYDKLNDEQIAEIKNKINKVNWIIDNTAIGNVESLDLEKGARVLIGDKEVDIVDFIKSKGYNPATLLETFAQDSVSETISMSNITYDSETGKTNIGKLENIFNKLNWSDEEVEQFSMAMTGSKGLQKIENSKGEKNLAWAIIESNDNNTRNEGFKLVLTDKKYLGTLAKSVENNDLNNGKFVVIDLPSRTNKNSIEIIKKGGMEVSNIKTFNLFGSSNPRDLDIGETLFKLSTGELNKARHLNIAPSTYVSQMISKLNLYKEEIFDAIDNNRGEIVGSKYNRAIVRDIQKSSGFTGYTTVLDENGDLVRKLIGNTGDISKNNMVDTTNLINLLPFLAKENETINKELSDIFFRADKQAWNRYRDTWIDEITNPRDKNTVGARDFDKVDSAVREYYIKNLLGENGLIGEFINSESLKSISGYSKALPLLEEIYKNGSQLLGSKIAQRGMVTIKDANVINPGSDIVGPIRDLVVQQTQYVPIHLGAVEKYMNGFSTFNEYTNELNSRNITLGRTFESIDQSVVDLLENSTSNGVIEGITGKVKIMNDHDILNLVNDFESKLDANSAKKFADKYGLYKNFGNEELVTTIRENLNVFKNRSMVYEQRAFGNPILKNLFGNVPDIHQFNINNVSNLKVSKGDSIKDGSILGYDANDKPVIYRNKRAGIITGIDNGIISVNPFERAIYETKVNYGITEKSVIDILDDTPIFRALYDELIGRDVAFVANPNQKKHLAGMFAFNEMRTIGQYLLQNGSEVQQQEFASLLNNIGGSNSRVDVKEINGQKIKRFLYGHSSQGNTFEQYKSVVDGYMKIAKSRSDDPFYGKLINILESNRSNSEAILDISIMQHNTQYSSQSDDFLEDVTGHHGGKHTMRDSVYLGRKVGYHPDSINKFYIENPDGTKKATSKAIVENIYKTISKSEEYISAQQDIKNIQYAIQLQRQLANEQAKIDTNVAKKMLVKKVSLSELYLPTSDTNAERIAETIFGIGEGYNVLEIDLGDMKITDPLTNKKTNTFFMPVLKNQFIDGGEMLVKLDTQKAMNEFYNNLQKLMLNKEFDRTHAENSIRKFWEETFYSINNKDGYLNQKVTSGRLPFSSNALYGGIVAPLYDDKMNLQYDKFNVNLERVVDINGKKIKGMLDVSYITEQHLREMIGDKGLEDIGFQLVHDNFDNNERFKKLIYESGLLDNELTPEVYEKIGREFMMTEGIAGLSTRYPVFHPNAGLFAKVRLNPIASKGTSVFTLAHTALKQKADIDGDNGKIAILGNRDATGRFVFARRGTEFREHVENLIDAEALDNVYKHIPEAIESYNKLAKDNSDGIITPEMFKKLAESNGMKDGRWDSDEGIQAIINARNKKAISDMSTPNYMIFDIATSMFEQNKGELDASTIRSIQDFTQLVEQSPISAKFATVSNSKRRINASAEYATSIADIVTSLNKGDDIKTPFSKMIESLGNMDILDFNEANAAAESLNKNLIDILTSKDSKNEVDILLNAMENANYEGFSKTKQSTLFHGLAGVYKMFNDDFLLSSWYDTSFNYRTPNHKNFMDKLEKLANGEVDSSTFKGEIMNSILNSADVTKSFAGTKFERVGSVSNRLYFDVDGSVYNVTDGTGFSDNTMLFEMRDVSDRDKKLHFVNDYEDALTNSNKSINKHIKNELGLREIEISGSLSAEDLKMFENEKFASTYVEGRNIIDDYSSKGIIKKSSYKSILDEYNERIIQAGRNAKDINEVRSYNILKDVISTNLTYIYSNFDYESFTEDFFYDYATPGSALKMFDSQLEEKSVGKVNINKLSNRGDKSSNIIYKSIAPDFDSYIEDMNNTISDIIKNNGTLNGLDDNRKRILSNALLGDIDAIITNKEIPNINNLSEKLFNLYTENKDEFMNNYSWGLDIKGAIAGIDLTSSDGINNAIETVTAFGEARVGFGRYLGNRVSELSKNQLEEVKNDFIVSLSSGANEEFVTESMNAITNYEIIKNYVANENIHNNDAINEVINTRTAQTNKRNYTTTMKNLLDKENLEAQLLSINDEMNEAILQKGKAKTKKVIAENIDKASNSFTSHMSGKAFIVGAGILAATTMMMSYSGVASSLDPGQTPSAKKDDDKTFTPKPQGNFVPSSNNSSNVYMSPRTSTKIRMNSQYGSINDSNVIRALNFSGGPNARVQIYERNGQNNNSWLQDEIANNLV